jgi:uncharacterized protein
MRVSESAGEGGDGRRRYEPSAEDSIVRVFVRPLGSPLPIGFFGFAMGTLIFSLYELKVIPQDELHTVALLLLGSVFPMQLASGLLAYLGRDTPGATAITLLATSWLGLGVVLVGSPPGETSSAVGVYVLAVAAALLIFGILSFKGKVILGVAMLVAAPRYALLGLYELTGTIALSKASGVLGLVLVVIATYGGVALLLEDTAQRTIWPIARRGVSRLSLEGDIHDQLDRLAREPGVRAQL